jgi:AraC-like DNA-binding protein
MNDLVNPVLCGALILLSFLSFTNPNNVNVNGNKWFCAFVISIFFVVFDEIYFTIQKATWNGILSVVANSFSFYIAPIFYISICYFVTPNRQWKWTSCLHFLLGMVAMVVSFSALKINERSSDVEISQPQLFYFVNTLYDIFTVLLTIQLTVYCFFIMKKLKKHEKSIETFRSYTENIDLKWLKNIVFTVIGLTLFWVVDLLFLLSSDDFLWINFFLLGVVFFISYHFVKQKEVFPFTVVQTNEIIEIVEEFDEPEKKQLIDDTKLQESKRELMDLMASKKLFTDPEISLVKLSVEMNCSPHLLSYVVNNGFNENFYQFISRYRIDAAKEMILDSNKNYLGLLGIGFEVGFNSKSAFNSTFKKITGKTPSEFKKSNLIE